MPGKSPSQRIEELSKQIHELESAFKLHQLLVDHRLDQLEANDAEHTRIEDELRNKVTELTAKIAALEERSRNQEKTSDRGFNFGQAVVISLISMIGGALLSLLVQLAIKK
jgi:hypothetical protein